MNDIRTPINDKLDAFATSNYCGAGMLELQQDDCNLRCRVLSTDRLACEIESIQLLSNKLAVLGNDDLEVLAERLTDRISYLEESLTVVEKDVVAVASQLRSTSPLVVEGTKSYFELMVGRNGMLLQRYEKSAGNQRQTIPAVLTRAIIGRLCADLMELSE